MRDFIASQPIREFISVTSAIAPDKGVHMTFVGPRGGSQSVLVSLEEAIELYKFLDEAIKRLATREQST